MKYILDTVEEQKLKEILMLFCNFDIIIVSNKKDLFSHYYDVSSIESIINKNTYFFSRNKEDTNYILVSIAECLDYSILGFFIELKINDEKFSLFVGDRDRYGNMNIDNLIYLLRKKISINHLI